MPRLRLLMVASLVAVGALFMIASPGFGQKKEKDASGDGPGNSENAPGHGGEIPGNAFGKYKVKEPGEPVPGESVDVEPVEGTVSVKLPGESEAIPLAEAGGVPVGSVVDAREGSVALTSAAPDTGTTQTASFGGSAFLVRQAPGETVTDLQLRGSVPRSCTDSQTEPARRVLLARGSAASWASSAVRAAAAPRRRVRRLWGSGRGRFRTSGRHGSATVRGTKWLTEDRCDGTLVRVREGSVAVRDHRRRRTVTVRAGRSYVARAR